MKASTAVRAYVWERDEGTCGICGELADPLDWNADHIIPEALGGPTTAANLRVTHPRCNRTRTLPARMTDDEIAEAASEWTANEFDLDMLGTSEEIEAWLARFLCALMCPLCAALDRRTMCLPTQAYASGADHDPVPGLVSRLLRAAVPAGDRLRDDPVVAGTQVRTWASVFLVLIAVGMFLASMVYAVRLIFSLLTGAPA